MWVNLFFKVLKLTQFLAMVSFFSFLKRLFFCTQYIRIPFVNLSVIFRLTFFNGKHLSINDVSMLKNVS